MGLTKEQGCRAPDKLGVCQGSVGGCSRVCGARRGSQAGGAGPVMQGEYGEAGQGRLRRHLGPREESESLSRKQ